MTETADIEEEGLEEPAEAEEIKLEKACVFGRIEGYRDGRPRILRLYFSEEYDPSEDDHNHITFEGDAEDILEMIEGSGDLTFQVSIDR